MYPSCPTHRASEDTPFLSPSPSNIFPQNLCIFQKKSVSLQKKSCTRQFESKLSLRSLAFSLQKKSCTRQFESNLTLRSLAFSLQKKAALGNL